MMNKRDLYDALAQKGIQLPPYEEITQKELQAIYDEPPEADSGSGENTPSADGAVSASTSGADEPKPADSEPPNAVPAEFVPRVLVFSGSGWCAALERSYFRGRETVRTQREYDALRPFADKEQ